MNPFPKEILPKHTAIFGMTGSGKSTTARDLVEQVVPQGSRVCILDIVKSDWWGITSSADGKKPGLPFTILGGPKAHLPLHRNMGKAVGEVVCSGALPLSIIDMADFGMGDASHFFVDFAQTLMRKMRGVLYLVIEEAHEIAPKERAGFKAENLGVYWAKKLATAGRTKGLRLVVCSQRVQALHNAVIGSCENMVVHRMTSPPDQKPVVDWLKANTKDKALRQAVEESMSDLPTGSGWLCSGEAKIFQLTTFPRARTFDNTAAPTDDTDLKEVKTASVNTEELRTILAGALKEAESSDPVALKRRIAELERDARKAIPASSRSQTSTADLIGAREEGRRLGFAQAQQGFAKMQTQFLMDTREELVKRMDESIGRLSVRARSQTVYSPRRPPAESNTVDANGISLVVRHKSNGADSLTTQVKDGGAVQHHTIKKVVTAEQVQRALYSPELSGTQQKIVDAIAELEQLGASKPTRELLCFMAGYSNVNSKGFANAIGSLRSARLIEGTSLTDEGRAIARPPAAPRTSAELQAQLIAMLGGAAGRILKPLIDSYPDSIDRDALVEAAGYGHKNSKGFMNALGRLRTLGFLDYPEKGSVIAKSILFLE